MSHHTDYAAGEPYARRLMHLQSRLRSQIQLVVDLSKRWPDESDTPARWLALGRLEATVQLARDSDELCRAVESAKRDLDLDSVTDMTRRIAMKDLYALQQELRQHAERMRKAILDGIT